MKNFDEFEKAIRLDFRDLSDDGTEFEFLVQELLQEMGMHAERTGAGQDKGVDIIAQENLNDMIGAPIYKKYVVQCKHFAHSGKSVGVAHIHDVIDTITQQNANGYLLVTSTDITSSLKEKLEFLKKNSNAISIEYWDKISLEKMLMQHPALVTKYFPTRFNRIKITIPKFKSKKSRYCKDLVLSHFKEFVGIKYIPKLYVRRNIEDQFYNNLISPALRFQDLMRDYESELKSYLDLPKYFPDLNAFIIPRGDTKKITFDWLLNHSQLRDKIIENQKIFKKSKWNPLHEYRLKGPQGVENEYYRILRLYKKYISSVEETLKPYIEACNFVFDAEEYNNKAREYNQKIDANNKKTRNKKSISKKKKPTKKKLKYPWRHDSFTKSYALKKVRIASLKDKKSVTFYETRLIISDFLRKIKKFPLLKFEKIIEEISHTTQIVVDRAGSGKTNLSCRISIRLLSNSFVLFLTGKALGIDYNSIKKYILINALAATDMPTGTSLKIVLQELYDSNFPLVLILDGINEASDIRRMKENLRQLNKLAQNHPIRILITTRSEYWEDFRACFTNNTWKNIYINKIGDFNDKEHSIAIPVYLDHYKINVRLESKAWEQLKRPLLLRFFCEAYGDAKRKRIRTMPPIEEVRLFRLFGEYYSKKYKNISNSLSKFHKGLTFENVEEVSSSLVSICMGTASHRLPKTKTLNRIKEINRYSHDIYRALLDEDIIIEETIEGRGRNKQNYISFVYEAFMEYLLARSVIHESSFDDERLLSRVLNLLENEDRFLNVKGVLTFLLPYTVNKCRKTYSEILSQFSRNEYKDACIPALINLWDSDWENGIMPILRAVANEQLNMPVFQVANWVLDWAAEHSNNKTIFESIINDTETFFRLFGDKTIKFVNHISQHSIELKLDSMLSVIEKFESETNAIDFLYHLLNPDTNFNLLEFNKIEFFARTINACYPIFLSEKEQTRNSRDWALLELTGRLGEMIGYAEIKRQIHCFVNLNNIVECAIFDNYCTLKKVNLHRRWWGKLYDIDEGIIEEKANIWIDDNSMSLEHYDYYHDDFEDEDEDYDERDKTQNTP
jgi:hypothetical protein